MKAAGFREIMIGKLTMDRSRLTRVAFLALVFLAYVAAGRLGLQLAFVNESATAVWAPTGIAIAAFLLLDLEIWPIIFLGAFVVNLMTTNAFLSSFLIAGGNTLEGVVAAYLIRRFASGANAFDRTRDILKFSCAAVVGATIAATIGTLSLALLRLAPWSEFGSIWTTWWLGDTAGALIIAPLIILWADRRTSVPAHPLRLVEGITFFSALVVVNLIVFGNLIHTLGNRPTGFFLVPLLAWPALRFAQRETATATLVSAGIAIWGTLHGWGPFGGYLPAESLLMMQGFIGVMALTSLTLSSAVSENTASQEKLSKAYDTALDGWSKALDIRDQATEGHSRRVAVLAAQLAEALGLSARSVAQIRRGALLHDIGKISIPDEILFKPNELTEAEWEIMRKHPTFAYEILKDTALEEAIDIPYAHHEKWDGSGYPRGLKGMEIPLAARIFAVVDVWDALRSERPYRQAMSDNEVFEHLASLSGTHFDPDILKAFIDLMKKQPASIRYGAS
jgi:putative nucleotidyltransferase with HDIG domain